MSLSVPQQRLQEWAKAQVSVLAGYPDDGQIATYLISLSSKQELGDYAKDLFGASNNTTVFVNELWSRRNELTSTTPMHPLLRSDSDDTNNTTAATYGVVDNNRPANKPLPHNDDDSQHDTTTSHYVDPSRFRGVKVKYVKPKAKAGNTAAARTRCACQAREHQLYTNCTACGKVVCVVEGEGECFYCTSYVTKQHTTAADSFVLQMQQKAAAAYRRTGGGMSEVKATDVDEAVTAAGLARAEQQKQKLLDYSAANVARSRVIDQQSDFYEFESNKWLNEEERKVRMAEAKREEEKLDRRRQHTVSIDLVNGQVIAHSSDPLADENRGRQLKSDGVEIVTRDDEERQTRDAAAATTASSSGGGVSAFNMRRSGVADAGVNAMVEEMKIVSARQYYNNDTLTGKARVVYEQMQAAMETEDKAREQVQKRRADQPKRTLFTSRVVHDDDIQHSTFDQDELGVSSQSLWSNISDEQQLPPADTFQSAADDEPDCLVSPATIVPSSSSSSSPFSDSTDTGTTLSLHQPWASLVVLGIKRFEGRGWYTPYRGRLWIASTAHQSTDEENKQLEADYRTVYGDKHIPFPASYPHSALLGCVELVDVLEQSVFQRLRAVRGEVEDSGSGYVFVCERPRVLSLPVSISGQHKLWQLSRAMVEGVQRQLVEVSERWRTGKVKKKDGEGDSAAAGGGGGAKRKTLTVLQKKKGPRMPNEA